MVLMKRPPVNDVDRTLSETLDAEVETFLLIFPLEPNSKRDDGNIEV